MDPTLQQIIQQLIILVRENEELRARVVQLEAENQLAVVQNSDKCQEPAEPKPAVRPVIPRGV